MGLDWGNVPAWVGSILTGSSLAVAAITYVRSAEERRRENAENARAQAALVSSWPVNLRRWQVRNGNTVAVSVQARIDDDHRSEPVVLYPSETRALRLPSGVEVRTTFLPLLIVDSFGRRWIRHGDGELAEVRDREPKGSPTSPRSSGRPETPTWEDRS
jgi:hypothetical protein